MSGRRDPALARADRLYGRLLWLLPGGFRREYGAVMRRTFADLCAARTDANGRGLAPVLAHGVAELAGGAVAEWAVTLFGRDRWHRSAATAVCVLAGLLVLYSQVRYPANLPRLDYLAEYLLLLAMLAALAHRFATGATVSARTVSLALATLPGWLAGPRYPLAAAGYGTALILAAAISEALHRQERHAGIRAGVAGGVLAGVTVFAVTLTGAIFGMNRLMHDTAYYATYLRTGQSDPAAYLIGSRICSASTLLVACVAAGTALGLAAQAGAALADRRRNSRPAATDTPQRTSGP